MSKTPTIEEIWGFDPEALHEDDLRYGYVIPEEHEHDTPSTGSNMSKYNNKNITTGTTGYGWSSGWSSPSNSFKSTSTYQRHDHDGDVVFTLFEGTDHEVQVGAASDHGKYVKEADVLVNCASHSWSHDDGTISVYGGDFTGLNKYLGSGIETLGVKWSDGGKPPVPGSFFRDVIETVKARGGGKIVFACVGGHGRTGTALAATLLANGVFDKAADAIRFVRKEHCYKACETAVQLEWLCALAGAGEKTSDKDFPLHSYAAGYAGGSTTTKGSTPKGGATTTVGKNGTSSGTSTTSGVKAATTTPNTPSPKSRAKGRFSVTTGKKS